MWYPHAEIAYHHTPSQKRMHTMKKKLALVGSLCIALAGNSARAMEAGTPAAKVETPLVRNYYGDKKITPDMLRSRAVSPTGWLAEHREQLQQLAHFPSTADGAVPPIA